MEDSAPMPPQKYVILYIEDVDLNTIFSMSAPTLSVSSAALGMWI